MTSIRDIHLGILQVKTVESDYQLVNSLKMSRTSEDETSERRSRATRFQPGNLDDIGKNTFEVWQDKSRLVTYILSNKLTLL